MKTQNVIVFSQEEMLIARISAQIGVKYAIATDRLDLQSDTERESQVPTRYPVNTPVIMDEPEEQ